MTNVTSGQSTISRFKWTIPCRDYDGTLPYAVVGDMTTAYAMARSEAERQGIKVDNDDWARISPSDEEIVIYFDVEVEGT